MVDLPARANISSTTIKLARTSSSVLTTKHNVNLFTKQIINNELLVGWSALAKSNIPDSAGFLQEINLRMMARDCFDAPASRLGLLANSAG